MRELLTIEPAYLKVGEDQIQSLSDELYSSLENDPSLLLPALKSLDDFELLDILHSEWKEMPDSPLSIELRRRVREHCTQAAKKIAQQIITS